MYSLKIKRTSSGIVTLTDPRSPIGELKSRLHVCEIYGIPDDVPLAMAMHRIMQCSWGAMPESVSYAEIAPGKIFAGPDASRAEKYAIKIKSSDGNISLTDPQSPIGELNPRLHVCEVYGIPGDVSIRQAMHRVTQCAWLSLPERVSYADLAPGKIFYERESAAERRARKRKEAEDAANDDE